MYSERLSFIPPNPPAGGEGGLLRVQSGLPFQMPFHFPEAKALGVTPKYSLKAFAKYEGFENPTL